MKTKTGFKMIATVLSVVFSLSIGIIAYAAPPTVDNITKSETKNSVVNFSDNDFIEGFSADGGAALTTVKIITLPTATDSTFLLDTTPVTAGLEIPIGDIDTLVFTPANDWTGSTSFEYQAKADAEYSASATVTINITQPAPGPLSVENITLSVIKNTPKNGTLVGASETVPAESFDFIIEDAPLKGSVNVTNVKTGEFTYTPFTDQVGADTFKFKIVYAPYESALGTVTVDIADLPESNPLSAGDLNITTQKNTPKTGMLLGSSSDNPPQSFDYMIVTAPTKGSVDVTNIKTGAFTYTPHTDQLGADTFTYKIVFSPYESAHATVTVNIEESSIPVFPYADMQGHWAAQIAARLADEDIIIGEKNGDKYYYNPDKQLTRGDFLLMMAAVMGEDNLPEPDPSFKFADDSSIPYWLKDIAYRAHEAKVISGISENGMTYLSPKSPLTRIEAMVMLNNAMAPSAQSSANLDYADVDTFPSWAIPALKNLEGYGLINGYEDNTLRPFERVSKAQATKMVTQLLMYIEEYPDTIDKWNGITPTSATQIKPYIAQKGYMSSKSE